MNKDVIYIEPEDDITDIIAKVKNAKTKIIALVPPKKAGVLRSAVNFKLIAKAALQNDKTVVLISTDENLVKFAHSVKMPVAKTLNSKPQLATDDEEEFGDDEEDDIIEEEKEPKADAEKAEKPSKEKKDGKTGDKKATKEEKPKAIPVKRSDDDVDMEIEAEEEKEDEPKKKSSKKIPNFKKYRLPIILGALASIVLVVVLVWAFAIAPAAKVIVHVRTTDRNFSEKIQLTTNPDEEDIEAGIFYMEEKTLEKTASADFEATGEVDKGTKAGGTLTIKRSSPVIMTAGATLQQLTGSALTIPTGAKFTYNGLTYVTTAEATLRAPTTNDLASVIDCRLAGGNNLACDLAKDISTTVKIEAAENGDKFNMDAVNSGWSTTVSGVVPTSSTAISGGTSKIIKVVSEDDLAAAEESLDVTGEPDAKNEMSETHKNDFILIKNSFNVEDGEVSSSPALGEEVANDVAPKVIKKTTYKIYAVSREAISQYIEKQVKDSIGDNTQTVYTTGAGKDEEKVLAFFESYKNSDGKHTAKLKSTVKTGPLVTPEMVSEKVLGQKVGQVRTMLTSINGVTDVEINRSYFWVTSIPSDINKVEIEITVK